MYCESVVVYVLLECFVTLSVRVEAEVEEE